MVNYRKHVQRNEQCKLEASIPSRRRISFVEYVARSLIKQTSSNSVLLLDATTVPKQSLTKLTSYEGFLFHLTRNLLLLRSNFETKLLNFRSVNV